MGNVTSTVQKATTLIQNEAKSISSTSQAIDQNMKVKLDLSDTNCDNIVFTNKAKMVSNLNMGSVADSLAKASQELSSEQTIGLGLGLNVNSTVSERSTAIRQKLEQSCKSEQNIKQNLDIDVKGKQLNCKQLQGLNEADLTTACVINTVMSTLNKDEFVNASKQSNDILGSITKLLSAPIMILIGVILFFAALILLFRLLKKPAVTPAAPTEYAASPEFASAPISASAPDMSEIMSETGVTDETVKAAMAQLFGGSTRRRRHNY